MAELRRQPVPHEIALASEKFDQFCAASSLKTILGHFRDLCDLLSIKPTVFPSFYPKLKSKLRSWKAQALWVKFDKRASHKCYNRGKACPNTRVLIIGAGPCGLRTAIEAQLLGAKVVVVEKRDRITRHNVLHLWPFVIHDLKSLGAKKFFGKFCAGSIDHISIRQLQCILLKVALILGVEIHEGVGFESLVEPPEDQSVERIGWRANVSPADHPVSQYEFDVLIGADGKRNTLDGFKRKEFRGKLAIAITANFINRHTEAEARVEEISGVAFIFNQKFFKDLYAETGIDLENIVYYKDETHYFVMTAKKQSLIEKGVILNDYADTAKLLAVENVDKDALQEYARQAADFSTNYKLPHLEFAVNHYGQPDVAMFDFTSMFAAENACRVIERHGHRLLQILVGDSLLEPFWPTGSGCARGFLSSMDACWAVRSWSSGQATPLEVLAERESIYRLLGQTTPENLQRDYGNYTLDPHTRYPNLNTRAVMPIQVRGLYDTDDPTSLEQTSHITVDHDLPKKRRRKVKDSQVHPDTLLHWLKKQVALYSDLYVENMTSSFKNGLILCAIIHRYRPDLIDFHTLNPNDVAANNQLAFDTLERELGIPPVMTGKEMEECDVPDKLTMLSYLSQIYDTFRGEIPHIKHPKLELDAEDSPTAPRPIKIRQLQHLSASQKVNIIGRLTTSYNHSRNNVSRKRFSTDRDVQIGTVGTHGANADRRSDTSRKSRSKRRSLEKEKQNADEERQKRLEEIHQNRLERERRKKYLRHLTTLQFFKSMQMLQTNCRDDDAEPFEDYSIFLYRQTAPSFEERVKDLERKLYYPDREARFLEEVKKGGTGEEMSGRIKTLEEKFKGTAHIQKKPKDLNRAIGKIEKSDWNVKELEKKIHENKMGRGVRQENPERVPKWSRDQFVDKFEAVKSKLETKNTNKEQGDKYSDIDTTLKIIGKKLKEGNALDAGPRGSNKVSAMAEQFAVKTTEPERPVQRSNSKAALIFPTQGGSETCHFCKKRVYVMERLSTEGRFFHRGCFRCEYCGTTLRIGSHTFDRDSCRFYCAQHYGMQGMQKMKLMKKDQELKAVSSKVKQTAHNNLLKNTDALGLGTPEGTKGSGVDVPDQRTTPERIEFENLVTSDVEVVPGEMDEDEWTDRNFGASAAEGSSDSASDMSDSGDEENEVFEEAVEQPLTADETRRLAENWSRRYSKKSSEDVQNGIMSTSAEKKNVEDDESISLNDADSEGEFSYKEYESDEDDSETATEGEDEIKARELRKQEVYLKVPELKKRQSDSDSGSETEVQSEYTTDSDEEEVENSATEIETDSEFEHDNIPAIIIDDRNITKRRHNNADEPIKVQTRAGHIHPVNGTVKSQLPLAQGIKLNFSPIKADSDTAKSISMSNLVTGKNIINNSERISSPLQLTPLINPRQGDYLLNRTHSTEGIASKLSLELKKKYLLGASGIGGSVKKSGSASTIDSKLKNFVDIISEQQKLLHPAPEPSPSMQAYLQGMANLRSSSSTTHFTPAAIIIPSLQLSAPNKTIIRKEKELPDDKGQFEHICGKQEYSLGSAEVTVTAVGRMDDETCKTDKSDLLDKHTDHSRLDKSNSVVIDEKAETNQEEEEVDYRPRSPVHETSIVVPDVTWKNQQDGSEDDDDDDEDDDEDDNDVETDSLSSNSSSTREEGGKHKSQSPISERIPPRVEIHDFSEVLITDDIPDKLVGEEEGDNTGTNIIGSLVVEKKENGVYTDNQTPMPTENITSGNMSSVDHKFSHAADAVVVEHFLVESDHSSPSTPPSRSDFSESLQNEGTFAALTETELSDWAHDGDAVVSEDLDDVEFNINPQFVTIRHQRKLKHRNANRNKSSSTVLRNIAKTEDFEEDVSHRISTSSEKPEDHVPNVTPCLLSDFDNIEFMDTCEENESDSEDLLAATNKTLIKNSGYVRFIDSDDLTTPVLEMTEQVMPVPVLPTLVVSECEDDSEVKEGNPSHEEFDQTCFEAKNKERVSLSAGEEEESSIQPDGTTTEETTTSEVHTVKINKSDDNLDKIPQNESEVFYTPLQECENMEERKSLLTYDSVENEFEDYTRNNLQEQVSPFSNLRDSLDIRKSRRKNKTPHVLQMDELITEESRTEPKNTNNYGTPLSPLNIKSPNTSRKLEEISRERLIQKDIIHKMVLDKHLPHKRSCHERKLRKSHNGVQSPSAVSPPSDVDSVSTPQISPNKEESHIPTIKRLEMPTVVPPSPDENEQTLGISYNSSTDTKVPFSDDSVLVTEETENFFTPLTSFKNTPKLNRPLSYHYSFKTNRRPAKYSVRSSSEKCSSHLPDTPLTNPEAFSLPDIRRALFTTPDDPLKPPKAPPRTKHDRVTANDSIHGEMHKSLGLKNDVSEQQVIKISAVDSSRTPSLSPSSQIKPSLYPELGGSDSQTDAVILREGKKSKDRERRKSLIQAVSDFFHKKKDSPGSPSPPKTPLVNNQSQSKDGKFRLKFTKQKDKTKDKTSPGKQNSSSDLYFFKDADTSKDHRKRYGVLYDEIPPPIPPPPVNYMSNATARRVSEESCSEMEEDSRATALSTASHEGISSSGSLSRRHSRMQQRMSRQAQQKRLRMAQEIQRQLEELEVKQKELENRGVNLEKALRGEGTVDNQREEADLLKEWFDLLRERSELRRYERELLIRAEELELEDRHARLQQELRERLKKDDSEKTPDDMAKEGQILGEMLEIVERRDSLIALLEEDRQRYQAEDRDLEAQMLAKGLRLTPLRKESHV